MTPRQTPFTLFLSAISDGIHTSTATSLLAYFQKHGDIDPTQCDEVGRSLAHAWWQETAHRSMGRPSAATVAELLAAHPDLWTSRDRHGHSLSKDVLAFFLDGGGFSDQEVADWIQVLPEPVLRSWRPRHAMASGSDDGSELMAALLSRKGVASVQRALERGLGLLGRAGREPVAAGIHTPDQWSAYLNAGGSPDVRILWEDKQVPLWQCLRQRGDPPLKEAIESWAKVHRADRLSAVSDAEYWARLSRHATASDALKALKSASDWPSRRDSEGRNVLMAMAASNASAFAGLLKQPKTWSSPVAGQPDRYGRNVWAYALGHGCLDSGSATLLAAHVPPSLGPAGEGWLHQCFVPSPASKPQFSVHDAFRSFSVSAANRSTSSWWSRIVKAPELFWGGSKKAQQELAQWCLSTDFYWGSTSSFASSTPGLVQAMAAAPLPPDAHPDLLGVVVLATMVALSPRHTERVQELVAAGARLPSLPLLPDSLQKNLSEEDRSRIQGLALASAIPAADSPGAARARMRL